MGLVTPDFGLVFWMVLSFLIVLFILKKFAWKPILTALKAREGSIDEALKSAERARDEMAKLQADNEKIMKEARAEREQMIKEARDVKDRIIVEAKKAADIETGKMLDNAKKQIESEKTAAIEEIKEKVIVLSVEIAEKILKKNLDTDGKQNEYIKSLIKDIRLN